MLLDGWGARWGEERGSMGMGVDARVECPGTTAPMWTTGVLKKRQATMVRRLHRSPDHNKGQKRPSIKREQTVLPS